MKRQNGKKLYSDIGTAFRTKTTFDLSTDGHGYPNIGWLIAHWLLRDWSEFDRNQKLYGGYANQIHSNLWSAIRYLREDFGIKVYRSPNGHKIEYITLDPNYREAVEMDYNRIVDRTQKINVAALKEIQFKHSNRLPEFASTTKLLPAGAM